jgi:chromosome segregation ATPase
MVYSSEEIEIMLAQELFLSYANGKVYYRDDREKNIMDSMMTHRLKIEESRASLATLTSQRDELQAELGATRSALGVDKEAMKQGMFQMEGEIDVLKAERDALKGEVEKAAIEALTYGVSWTILHREETGLGAHLIDRCRTQFLASLHPKPEEGK